MHKIEKPKKENRVFKISQGALSLYELQTAEVCCRSEGCLKMECHLGKMFHRLEVRAGINNIVCEVEEKFEISSAVQKTLGRIV